MSICFDNGFALSEIVGNSVGQGLVHAQSLLVSGDWCRARAGRGSGMRDSQHGGQSERSGEELAALARTVVARLAGRAVVPVRQINGDLLRAMVVAIASPDCTAFEALRPEIRRARLTEADLVDRYFPAVARQLGTDWAEDRSGWVDVSVGMARLQAMVHQIGRDWSSNATEMQATSCALLVLPDGEQHSFGVQVLAGQLRRQGVSVHLQIGARPEGLRALLKEHHYDCAVISVACEGGLDFCRRIVASLKAGSNGNLLVAVGGAVLDRPVDVRKLTGADMVAEDPVRVLAAAHQAAGLRLQARSETTTAAAGALNERLDAT